MSFILHKHGIGVHSVILTLKKDTYFLNVNTHKIYTILQVNLWIVNSQIVVDGDVPGNWTNSSIVDMPNIQNLMNWIELSDHWCRL